MSLLGPTGQPLSPSMPGADDMTKSIDLYDSEIIAIEKVTARLKERSEVPRDMEAFNREIKERFAEIGLVADVVWWYTDVEGVYAPDIVFKGRTEAKVFDRDKQVHEVTSDLLGFNEGGVIKTDKAKVQAMIDGSYKGKGTHQH